MEYLLITNKSIQRIQIPELKLDLPCRGSTAVLSRNDWYENPATMPFRSMVSTTTLNNAPHNEAILRKHNVVIEQSSKPEVGSDKDSVFQSMFMSMMSKIEELTAIVKSKEPTVIMNVANAQGASKSASDVVMSDRVDFIPKTIVPDVVVNNMKSNSSTANESDVNESATALKKLRKKKTS